MWYIDPKQNVADAEKITKKLVPSCRDSVNPEIIVFFHIVTRCKVIERGSRYLKCIKIRNKKAPFRTYSAMVLD